MLSQKQLSELRVILQQSQNPLFFFDNDVDGLASFLLLRRFIERGKGVAIKSFPALSSTYSRKIYELKPDMIFVLDKPLIEKSFIQAAEEKNLPLIWIDHHEPQESKESKYAQYFNPLLGKKKSNEPVTYWCYKITEKKDDEWIAMLGCIADWYIPDFSTQFAKKYPDLFGKIKDPAKALYKTEIGKIVKILSFALKDRTSVVVRMLRFLFTVKSPYELLEKNEKTKSIYRRYEQINRKYIKLIERAKNIAKKKTKLLFFIYGGSLSLSGDIANELFYLFPKKVVVVAYVRGSKVNVSLRGKVDVREIAARTMEAAGIKGSSGGHVNAAGASFGIEDLPKFQNALTKLVG